MISKEQKFRLGIFIAVSNLALLLIVAVLVVPLLRDKGDPYTIRFHGDSVNNLNPGSAVKYLGVEIGKVEAVAIDPADISTILVQVRIKKGMPIKKDMSASLQYAGISGQKYVGLAGGSNVAPNVAVGSEIATERGIGERAEDIVANIDLAVKRINTLLSPENEQKISLFLANIENSSHMVSDIFDQHLKVSVANFSRISSELEGITRNFELVSRKVGEVVTNKTFEETLQKTAHAVDQLDRRISDGELGAVIKQLQGMIATTDDNLKRIANLLVNQQADMAVMLAGVRDAVENVAQLTRQLSEDPTLLLRTKQDKRGKK
jgi:phospholipid/cholesterol/gamma-HCH transport system substrate-binding protein